MGFISAINPRVIDTRGADKLGFFAATPTVKLTIPGELAPSASLGDVITQLTADENQLITYGLVQR